MKCNRMRTKAAAGGEGTARWRRVGGLAVLVSLVLGVLAALLPTSPARAQTTGEPTLAVNDVSVTEGNSGTQAVAFTITRSGSTTGAASVTWATAHGTATGADYVAKAATQVDFAAGQSTRSVSVTVKGDIAVEGDEYFSVNLSAPTGATIADGSGRGTIVNDDTSIVVNNVSLLEGNSGTKVATFAITRKGLLSNPSSVTWATGDGTAVAPGDYVAQAPKTENFGPGETVKKVSVTVRGDTETEANETFSVNLSQPVGATIADATGQGTIKNDDQGLSINDVTLTEGDSGTKTATFTITRSGITTGSASVTWATVTGTAQHWSADYVAGGPTTVGFAPGMTTVPVTITVNGDTAVEPDETFSVKLSAPVGATITDDTGTGTILNDDASLAIDDVTVTEGNRGDTPVTFTITRSGDLSRTVSVDWRLSNSYSNIYSDAPAQSGTVTLAPGIRTEPLRLVITGDIAYEPDEGFYVFLSSPSGASLPDPYGYVRILNDDAPMSSIQSHNYPNHYVRHKDGLGELTQLPTQLEINEGTFRIVPGLANQSGVSFESTTSPGWYLRYTEADFRVTLQPFEATHDYITRSTFLVGPGLADGEKTSFRALWYPNRYLRHQSFHLYLHEGSDQLFKDDSTFQVVAPPAPWPTVTVPDVVGWFERDARDDLEDAGFVVSATYVRDCNPGVLSQTPEGGEQALPGSTVSIVVAQLPANTSTC